MNRGWLLANPARQLKPPAVGDLATLPLSHAEVSRLLLACDQIRGMWSEDTPHVRHRARALVLCLLYSGLRISDVALLRGSALEDSGHLVLHTAKTGVPIKVLLHREAATALRALPAPGGNPAYFFWTGRGSVEHCAKSLGRTITRLGRIADVHAHPHRFRDTFAVELLSNGADIRTVQLLLGNESVRTTEKHYAHFVAAHQALLDSSFRTEAARPLPVHAQSNRRRNAK